MQVLIKDSLIKELKNINTWIRLYMSCNEFKTADILRDNRNNILNKIRGV